MSPHLTPALAAGLAFIFTMISAGPHIGGGALVAAFLVAAFFAALLAPDRDYPHDDDDLHW